MAQQQLKELDARPPAKGIATPGDVNALMKGVSIVPVSVEPLTLF